MVRRHVGVPGAPDGVTSEFQALRYHFASGPPYNRSLPRRSATIAISTTVLRGCALACRDLEGISLPLRPKTPLCLDHLGIQLPFRRRLPRALPLHAGVSGSSGHPAAISTRRIRLPERAVRVCVWIIWASSCHFDKKSGLNWTDVVELSGSSGHPAAISTSCYSRFVRLCSRVVWIIWASSCHFDFRSPWGNRSLDRSGSSGHPAAISTVWVSRSLWSCTLSGSSGHPAAISTKSRKANRGFPGACLDHLGIQLPFRQVVKDP